MLLVHEHLNILRRPWAEVEHLLRSTSRYLGISARTAQVRVRVKEPILPIQFFVSTIRAQFEYQQVSPPPSLSVFHRVVATLWPRVLRSSRVIPRFETTSARHSADVFPICQRPDESVHVRISLAPFPCKALDAIPIRGRTLNRGRIKRFVCFSMEERRTCRYLQSRSLSLLNVDKQSFTPVAKYTT